MIVTVKKQKNDCNGKYGHNGKSTDSNCKEKECKRRLNVSLSLYYSLPIFTVLQSLSYSLTIYLLQSLFYNVYITVCPFFAVLQSLSYNLTIHLLHSLFYNVYITVSPFSQCYSLFLIVSQYISYSCCFKMYILQSPHFRSVTVSFL